MTTTSAPHAAPRPRRPRTGQRRLRSAAAVVLIAAAATIPSTLTASAAPAAIDMHYPTDGSLALIGSTPIAGTIVFDDPAGGTVVVTNQTTGDACAAITTTSYFDCDLPIVAGMNEITVGATETADGGFQAFGINVRGIPAFVTFTSPDAGEGLVSYPPTEDFRMTGTGPAGETVTVEWAPQAGTYSPLCTALVDAAGNWFCDVASPDLGIITYRASVDMLDYELTDTVEVRYDLPPTLSTDYTFGPASVTVAATASGGPATGVTVSLYGIGDDYPNGYNWTESLDGCTSETNTVTCTFADLTPAIWNIYSSNSDLALEEFVLIPAAPQLSATVNEDRTVTVSGLAQADTAIDVRSSTSDTVLCTIPGTGNTGTCTLSLSAGSHILTGQARSVGFVAATIPAGGEAEYDEDFVPDGSYDGLSALTTLASVTVPPAPAEIPAPVQTPAPVATPTPAATPAPAAPIPTPAPVPAPWQWDFSFTGADDLTPGAPVGATGTGAPPGTHIILEIHSTPVVLSTTRAADDGTFRLAGTVPLDLEPGDHELVLRATRDGEEPREHREPVIVNAAPDVEAAPTEETPLLTLGAPTEGSGGAASRNAPDAPNALSTGLPTVLHLLDHPSVFVAAGALALALLFLVSIPTELLNSALTSGAGGSGRVFRALGRFGDRLNQGFENVLRSRTMVSVVVVLLLSIVYCLADPGFGFDLASLRMMLALAIALFVLSWGIGRLTGFLTEKLWGARSEIGVNLSVIPLAIVGVIVSRILDFSPGFFIGLAIGVELVRASRRAQLGASVLSFALVIGSSLLAWLGYSMLAATPLDTFGLALLNDTLVALTSEGLTAVAVAALPLAFLEGRNLWNASKAVWLVVFLVTEFVFCLIVLPTAMEASEVSNLTVWLIVLAGYCAVTLALWWWFARAAKREAAQTDSADVILSASGTHPSE